MMILSFALSFQTAVLFLYYKYEIFLFYYIYLQVKSKWGLAISAVVTVVASLLMSISICAVFGVTPSVNSGEIFPYLVVIIGLENVLVLTRSVVSTPLNLEVRYRWWTEFFFVFFSAEHGLIANVERMLDWLNGVRIHVTWHA